MRHVVADRHSGLHSGRGDHDQEEKFDAQKRSGPSGQSSSDYQTSAISALKETIAQVTALAGRGTVDTRRPGTIGLLRAIGGGELSRTQRKAIRLEAEALVQLASIYLAIGDLSSCEQETLKLAQLEVCRHSEQKESTEA